ncbi:MAG: outer membrane protein assembly factor BamA [Treponema sp.]|nr:outer membrane protein assembly factor BamA [Treponema sp.]
MKSFFKKLLVLVFFSVQVFALFAQEEDDEWFWNKPISEITFEGLKNVKKSELNGFIDIYLGQPFDEDNYSDMLDRLYAMDLFEDIVPYAKHAKKAGEVLLVFQIEERPVVTSVGFAGNTEIRNGELREKISVKASDVYVESKVLMDERILREYYIQKGYTDAKVGHRIEKTDSGVKVIYVVDEGSHVVISKINIQGCTIFSERSIKSKLALKEVGFLKDGAFQKSTLEADKQTIISLYNERGYMDADFVDVVLSTEENKEKKRNEMTITFIVQEGPQYIYTGTTFMGNEVFATEKLAGYIKLKEGSVFNYTKFQEGLMGITGLYYENGYMSLEFAPTPVKDSDRHEISYKIGIREHSRSHIENVLIKGNTKTKDYVIRREIPVEAGDIFSRDKIMNGFRNVYNLQFFSSVMPEYEMGSEENLINLVYTVEEQSTTTFQFGLTFSGTGLTSSANNVAIPFSVYGKLENSNLFGEGRSLSVATNISPTEQSVDFSYGQNWIGNLPVSYSQSLSFSHTSATSYRLDFDPDGNIDDTYNFFNYEGWTASLGTSIGKRWYPNFAILSLTGGLSNSITDYVYDQGIDIPLNSGIGFFANRAGVLNSVWTSFSMDGRDISYDPSKGWFANERLSWSGFIPKFEQEFFLKSDTKLEGYVTLFNIPVSDNYNFKAVFADYLNLQTIFPVAARNGDAFLSDSNKVYIDGTFNGRGWNDISSLRSKGKALLSNNMEVRIPVVPGYLGADLFFDTVAVKSEVKDMFTGLKPDDFYFSFGPGVRFLIPQFPLRFLFAWKFKPEDGKIKWAGNCEKYNGETFQFVLSFNMTNK